MPARIRLARVPLYPARLVALACALLGVPAPAFSEFISENSSFGTDTITRDTATDLRWLDLPISAGVSHAEILVETEPGGLYEDYRLATEAEVSTLFTNAGIDVSAPVLGDFVPQNYAPIVALTAFIGVIGDNGNCGIDCTFSYTQGWIDAVPDVPLPNFFSSASLAWFDNTAGQSPGDPAAPIGRAIVNGARAEGSDPDNAAWLVAPEPGGIALGATALFALSSISRVASQRRTRGREPRVRTSTDSNRNSSRVASRRRVASS
jgi:hypothetical protein